MTSKLQLESALKDAMRAQDDLRKRTLRMALSSIRLLEIEKGSELDDQAVTSILQKEVKTRQEAIDEAQRAGRPDLIQASRAEIAVLEEFLPSQMSPAELEGLASQVISELGATSQREMGQVMKTLLPRLAGRASGEQASQVVRKLLA
ncbi:MAG: hypothetical protein A2Z16_12410 [Chloroflexi bacterium RBG_16_54_18]|nr:MAG: hypothetical protein A2Z16_12410 [Chloroflexi bacterium RBG_16_54_18]